MSRWVALLQLAAPRFGGIVRLNRGTEQQTVNTSSVQ